MKYDDIKPKLVFRDAPLADAKLVGWVVEDRRSGF